MGAYGEASWELDRVVTAMAESRVLYLSRESGKPVRDGWRSAVLARYRRQAACLTARLGNLGEGASQAGCWQEGQSFVEDACGHRYGAKYSSERDKGLIGEESV